MGAFKDQTGNIYGKWTVLRKAEEKNSYGDICWVCRCECGTEKVVSGKILRRGKSKSCGCTRNIIKPGDKFGSLTILKDSGKRENRHKLWECLCDCGNIVLVRSSNLTTGNTKSCGCCNNNSRLKLLGKTFGLLTVIEDAGNDEKGNSLWKCQCKCGNIKIIKGSNLVSHNTFTCGCQKMSRGEIIIKNILDENKIPYYQEYIPDSLKNRRFDFAIKDKDNNIIRLIEFDGIQHFEEWDRTEESLNERQKRDQEKNIWAKENHIPLVRIPYWEIDNITKEMLLENNTFLV